MKDTPYQRKRREILFSVFDKYPDLSNRATAMLLSRNYPAFFLNDETARDLVRLYRGAKGAAKKQYINKKYYR
jgi:hypothetical protein